MGVVVLGRHSKGSCPSCYCFSHSSSTYPPHPLLPSTENVLLNGMEGGVQSANRGDNGLPVFYPKGSKCTSTQYIRGFP